MHNPVLVDFKALVDISNAWANKQTRAGLYQWHRYSGVLKGGLRQTKRMSTMASLFFETSLLTSSCSLFTISPCPLAGPLFRPQFVPSCGLVVISRRGGRQTGRHRGWKGPSREAGNPVRDAKPRRLSALMSWDRVKGEETYIVDIAL